MPVYSARYSHPLGGNRKALGGAAWNFPLAVTGGEHIGISAFEDFNSRIANQAAWTASGWTLLDLGAPVADDVFANTGADPYFLGGASTLSAVVINAGTAVNTGVNFQQLNPGTITGAAPAAIFDGIVLETGLNRNYFWAARVLLGSTATAWTGRCSFGVSVDLGATGIQNPVGGAFVWADEGGFMFTVDTARVLDFAVAAGVGSGVAPIWASTGTTTRSGLLTLPTIAVDTAQPIDVAFRVNAGVTSGSVQVFFRIPDSVGQSVIVDPAGYSHWRQIGRTLTTLPAAGSVMFNTFEVINAGAGQSDLLVDWMTSGTTRITTV